MSATLTLDQWGTIMQAFIIIGKAGLAALGAIIAAL